MLSLTYITITYIIGEEMYMSQMLYAGQSAREDVTFHSDF